MLEISTNNLGTRKKAKIDGHIYTVRKFSNLEQLDISQYTRRAIVLDKLSKNTTDEAQLEKLEAEANEISRIVYDIFIRLFDDGGDQSKSRALLGSMTQEEIKSVLSTIFDAETTEKALDEA